jgi:hypothetical protein
MVSTGGNTKSPEPYESCSPQLPNQAVLDSIVGAIEMLNAHNIVLDHIVHNVIHGIYLGLSQTSLADSLSQALSESMVDHARLFNMLMNHATQIQQSEDSNQHILESILPP